jgi:hypothetical protein
VPTASSLELLLVSCLAAASGVGCGGDDDAPAAVEWSVVHADLPGALTSVWGTSADDVWAVGGDAGDGPMVLHWDGATWRKLDSGATGDLWWVFGFDGGPVFMGGQDGHILRYEDGAFSPMTTPGQGTVVGLWGTSPDEMWAVGGVDGGAGGAFAWRRDGDAWVAADGFPAELAADHAVWKVWGSAADDVWLVGTSGLALHWDGAAFAESDLGGGESIFTVHHGGGRFAAVGGFATGLIFENDGSGWTRVDDGNAPAVVGVCLGENGEGYAVGSFGAFMERTPAGWREAEGPATAETLHALWIDPDGGVWTVGGQLQVQPLIHGVLAYRGTHPPLGELQ